MATCPRCRHDDGDKRISNRICKTCYRDIAMGIKPLPSESDYQALTKSRIYSPAYKTKSL